jgi:hypothetical protein
MALAASAELATTPTQATPTPAPTPEAAPTPTPTPEPSYIIVPAAWSPEVYVTVNRQRRSLARQQRFEVPAGATARVSFEYRDGDYQDAAVRSVVVGEGETAQVAVPIATPGMLQIQQKVSTPAGRVFLDGRDLGVGLVRRRAPAGRHQLRIEPATTGGTGLIERDVTVAAGMKLVVTFDLVTGAVVEKVGPLDPAG